jgi:methyltransferase-like protein
MIFTEVYAKTTGFVEKQVGDETILVPLSNQVAQMSEVFTLNELGSFIWQHIDGVKNVQDIINEVLKNYDSTEQIVINDVVEFVKRALNKGLIVLV